MIVGVVGATGMVGGELLSQIERRRFPFSRLLLFSASRGHAPRIVRDRRSPVLPLSSHSRLLNDCGLVFFAGSDGVSRRLAKRLARRGAWVIDDSSAFRLDPEVPLIIPEVNAGALRADRRLVAGPNCTMSGLAVALSPLHRLWKIRELRVASYQSVSGAGRGALEEFAGQAAVFAQALAKGENPSFPKPRFLPAPIAGNVIPQVGSFDLLGRSDEETKVAAELAKVLGAPRIKTSVTAVRVPTIRGHAIACWARFHGKADEAVARRRLRRAPGMKLHEGSLYPTPLAAAGSGPVHVGRLRRGVDGRELCLWIVSDNLLKGAALNAVQIAEEIRRRGWLNEP
jgi:aspartate-semialdehyde dehydrogenase